MNKKPNKILFYNPFSIWPVHFETDLELINQHVENGDDVTMLVCNGDLLFCEPNPEHISRVCGRCIARREAGFHMLGLTQKVKFRSLKNLTKEDLQILTQYRDLKVKTLEELKTLKFEDCDLGMGVASSLIDYLRDPKPDVSQKGDFVERNLRSGLMIYLSMKNHIRSLNPDRVYVFNGRFSTLRPALRAAQSLGIDVQVTERANVLGKYSLTAGAYPHDREGLKQRILQTWNTSVMDEVQKVKIGEQWYEDRRQGCAKGGLLYTLQQEPVLPDSFDPGKINVAIFNSSDDEWAAIDGWKNSIYKDQNDGIRRIIEDSQNIPDIHIYLRVHPNLKDVKNLQTKFIEELRDTYGHVSVVDADSPVSSYKLMDSVSAVITFGSTVGIEAAYSRKLSILVGPSAYEDLGACVTIASHDQLIGIIKKLKSDPMMNGDPEKRRSGAIKYAFYMSTYGIPFKLFEHKGFLDITYQGQVIRGRVSLLEKVCRTFKDNVTKYLPNLGRA